MRHLLPRLCALAAIAACDSFEPEREPEPEVNCGDSVCVGDNSCCAQRVNLTFQFQCLQAASACGGFALACDGPEDCGGRRCCLLVDDAVMIDPPHASCADTCGEGYAPMCHTPADCADPLDCINKAVDGGYGVCVDK